MGSTVYRYIEGGQLDTTFGSNGKFAFQLQYPDAPAGFDQTMMTEILIDSNGRIVLGGRAGLPGTYSPSGGLRTTTGALVRLNPNGGLDATFGSSFGSWSIPGATFLGVNIPTESANTHPEITDLALQSDGKLVASVYGGVSASGRLVRFDGNGVLEFVSPPNENVKGASSVAVDAQGRVYIGGYTVTSERFSVARYLPNNGSLMLDLDFDPVQHDGVLSTAFYGEYNSLQIDLDGRLFASGTSLIDTGPRTGSAVYAINKFVPERDDLSISITANTSQVLVDGSIIYTIQVNNTGDDAIFPAIQNIIPAGAVFKSLSVPSESPSEPSKWVFSTPIVGQAGNVIASRRSLKQSDGPQTFILQLRLVESLPIEILTNTLTVSSETTDYNTANNSGSIASTIRQDHSVSVGTSTLGLVAAGDLVTFPITVENRNAGDATHVLTAFVPVGSDFVSATGNFAYSSSTRTITWSPSTIQSGFNHVRQVVLRSTIAGYLPLTAQVSGVGTLLDLTPENNSSTSPTDAMLVDASGLVMLLKAEDNLLDQTDTHSGLPSSNISYAAGRTGQGQAFAFNGSNTSVDLGNWFTLQSFTIGMWIRPGNSQGTYADIIDNNRGPNWVTQYQNQVVNGKQRFLWGVFDGSTANIDFDVTPNAWQYLTITRDATTRVSRVYIDGQLQGSTTGTGDINYSNQFMRLAVGSRSSERLTSR